MFISTTLAIFALLSTTAFSDVHEIDKAHSSVNFKIRHLFAKTTGQFKKFTGDFNYHPKAIEKSTFTFVIDADSIYTDNEKRDKHLRSKDFFWVEKHKKISFKSKGVKDLGQNKFTVMGDLTMRGVTKPINVNMAYLGQVKDPWGNMKAGFEATAKLNRKDFGILWNKNLDSGGFILGDDVDIEIFLETTNKSTKTM